MSRYIPLNLFAHAGNEALQYSMFVRLFGTREKINDITNPRYTPIGDIMLPRNSLIHYQQHHPGDDGPSNTAPFISNYDKRINIFFNPNYEVVLGTIRNVQVQLSKLIKAYEGSHFIYQRTRNYPSVIGKEGELLVNNLAIGQIPIVYNRRTIFTPFHSSYNTRYTLMDSVNEFSKFNKHQFTEIQLPRTFPTYKELIYAFNLYKAFFNEDGEIVKYDKRALKYFQAEQSFWLLDLFGILMGFDDKRYSLFNRLNDDSKRQLEIIFTYNGTCWIVNLQNLINLIAYSDKTTDDKPSSLKINYFKRFYLNLINLVSPINEEAIPLQEEEETTEEEEGDFNGTTLSRVKSNDRTPERIPSDNPPVDDNRGSNPIADLYTSAKRTDPVPVHTVRNPGRNV